MYERREQRLYRFSAVLGCALVLLLVSHWQILYIYYYYIFIYIIELSLETNSETTVFIFEDF